MKPRMRLRQPAVPLLLALILGLEVAGPSRIWVMLLLSLGGLLLIAFVWAWSLSRNLSVRRESRLSWVTVGGQIDERITLSNTSLLPASWIYFTDRSTMPGFNAQRATGIGGGTFDQWIVTAHCRQRGLFFLGDAMITSGDPFGIFDVTVPAPQRTSMLVLPQIAPLPELAVSPSGIYGDGRPRRDALQQTIHASTVRDYVHGDALRQIHWPTTARLNKLFVRQMQSAPEGEWWILLDLDREMMAGSGWDSVEEQSVALAASLAAKGLHLRKSVGLISSGENLVWLPPRKGDGQRWEILEALAMAKPGERTLNALLERMHAEIGRHHSLIIITAATDIDWVKSVPALRSQSVVPTVMLFDPASFGAYASIQNTAIALEQHGIRCHTLSKGFIAPPNLEASADSGWSWHATPTGQIVPMHN